MKVQFHHSAADRDILPGNRVIKTGRNNFRACAVPLRDHLTDEYNRVALLDWGGKDDNQVEVQISIDDIREAVAKLRERGIDI